MTYLGWVLGGILVLVGLVFIGWYFIGPLILYLLNM